MLYDLSNPEADFRIEATREHGIVTVKLGGKSFKVSLVRTPGFGGYTAKVDGRTVRFDVEKITEQAIVVRLQGERIEFRRTVSAAAVQKAGSKVAPMVQRDALVSPMPGKVVAIRVKEGQAVKKGDPIVILESMKMESVLRSDREAVVAEILVVEGHAVKRGQSLVRYG